MTALSKLCRVIRDRRCRHGNQRIARPERLDREPSAMLDDLSVDWTHGCTPHRLAAWRRCDSILAAGTRRRVTRRPQARKVAERRCCRIPLALLENWDDATFRLPGPSPGRTRMPQGRDRLATKFRFLSLQHGSAWTISPSN
jgi:hypothetical protein